MGLPGGQKKTPRTAKEWADEGVMLGCRRKHREALEYFSKGMELCGDNKELLGTMWIHKGSTHFALHEWQEALRSYETAMQIAPVNEPVCWRLRAHVLYYWNKRKHYEEAKTCLANASHAEKAIYREKGARYEMLSYQGVEVPVDTRKIRDGAILEFAIGKLQERARLELIYGGSEIREC